VDESPRRGFSRLWWAHSVSQFGDQLTLVALPLAAYADTHSAVAVGVVASLEAVTAVAFGLVAGALADRLAHRRVLILTDVARALLLVALVAALAAPGGDLAALLVAATGLGITRVLHDAAESAAVPLVVDDARLVAANGRLQASEAAATAA
jgi:MFS family permease